MPVIHPTPATISENSASLSKQQGAPQRRVLPGHNRLQGDTILFRGGAQQKAAFSLQNPPAGYSVHFAAADDVSELVDFIEKIFGKPADRPAYEASCQHALQQGGYSYIIRHTTTPGKPIIGTAILNPNGYIVLGAVDKAHQSKGIAAAMMAGLIEKSAQAGMDKLHLTVEKSNPNAEIAIRVAQKAGFKKTGENPELWIMELGLKQPSPLAKPGRDTSLQAGLRPGIQAFSRNRIQVFPSNGLRSLPHNDIQAFPRNGFPTFPRRGIPNLLGHLRNLRRFFP